MAKRKRERMKQKAQRHKPSAVAAEQAGQQAEQPAVTEKKQTAATEKKQPVVTKKKQPEVAVKKSATTGKKPASTPALTGQRHLSAAAPEWKEWYAAISREFAADGRS